MVIYWSVFCSILSNSNHKYPTPLPIKSGGCYCCVGAGLIPAYQGNPTIIFVWFVLFLGKTYFFIPTLRLDVYIYFMIMLIFLSLQYIQENVSVIQSKASNDSKIKLDKKTVLHLCQALSKNVKISNSIFRYS